MEVEMASHPRARTIIAPPFYSSMIDIAFGLKVSHSKDLDQPSKYTH